MQSQTTDIMSAINNLSPDHHAKIGAIMKKRNITLNESGNKILVNISLVDSDTLDEIYTYIDYAKKRDQMLTDRDELAENMKLLLTTE